MSNQSIPIMPQIKNIVFLMLENRSLDNLLGWLYEDTKPEHVFPLDSCKDYEGLQTGKHTNPDVNGNPVPVTKITDIVWREMRSNGWGVPYSDPYEALRAYPVDIRAPWYSWYGVMNQFYGNQHTIDRLPDPGTPPAMQGFFQDYYTSGKKWNCHDILWTYTPSQLTVINSLARNFAISDRWFSSVPSDTNPNRAYSLCGTSLGRESNLNLNSQETFDTPTLFNQLAKADKNWKLYYHKEWVKDVCYTEYTFPRITKAGNGKSALINDFFNDAAPGTLPDFSYIEPLWTGLLDEGNDYHPPILGQGFVGPAENFLKRVFTALRNSPQWEDMLFIVTFDEHGGNYDHVPPPGTAINPDGKIGIENHFPFTQFGARVPTLLISPYIRKGTVFRSPDGLDHPFDHTSFIKTILMWAGIEPKDMNLGERAQHAPTFEDVLSGHRVNDTASAGQDHACPSTEEVTCHPAGTNKELRALMINVPAVATKRILAQSKTKEELAAAVALYWQDPKKFEDQI